MQPTDSPLPPGAAGVPALRVFVFALFFIFGRHHQSERHTQRVHQLTDGQGVHATPECVGHGEAMHTAIEITRPGGVVGRVGVPQEAATPASLPAFFHNVTIGGGPAPVRAHISELLPDILEGRIQPGRVFDRIVDGVPAGRLSQARCSELACSGLRREYSTLWSTS